MANQSIKLRVKRQDTPQSASYWEDFEIPYKPSMNVISCLMEIQKSPPGSRRIRRPSCWRSAT